MKIKLFGQNVSPACKYCELGRVSTDLAVVFCKKKGVVQPDSCCRSFDYAPLKRIPPRMNPMPLFSPEDFEI